MAAEHQLLVDKAKASVEKRVSDEQQAAIAWLRGCREEAQRGDDVARLMQKLSRPPAFLPAEAQPDLAQLRSVAQERIDNDAILKIEAAFREIADPQRQKECLQRLARLLEEQTSAGRPFWSRKA